MSYPPYLKAASRRRVPSINAKHVQIERVAKVVAGIRNVNANELAQRVIADNPKSEAAVFVSFERHIEVMEALAHV